MTDLTATPATAPEWWAPDRRHLTLSRLQLAAALRLAAAYGHQWAELAADPDHLDWLPANVLDRYLSATTVAELGSVLAEVEAAGAYPGRMAGIAYPGIGVDPADESRATIEHETMTGRTRWQIDPDGSVFISISRPAPIGAVLDCRVEPDGEVRLSGPGPDPLYTRHLAALAEAVAAVGYPWERGNPGPGGILTVEPPAWSGVGPRPGGFGGPGPRPGAPAEGVAL